MYTQQPKKLLIMNILDILRKYTDENHRLSQKEISEILEKEYNMTANRKSIRRNILNLMDCGYDIEYSKKIRIVPVKDTKTDKAIIDSSTENPKMEENYIWFDFYLQRQFTDSELRLLIDSVLFSKHIPYNQCKELVEKLEELSSIYFKSRVGYISRLSDGKTDNKELFLNIELLDEAISKNKKVSFKYTEYKTDKKIHVKKREDGTDREYIISPYQMAAKEGKYYLICNYDKYDDISNYRLDRIKDLKILDKKAKPFEKLQWANGRSLNLADYMKEHVYMFSSGNVHAKFRITKPMISDIIDVFGKDVTFSDEDEFCVTVSVYTNELAMKQFAKSFAPDVIVLEPKSLADNVKTDLEKALSLYK